LYQYQYLDESQQREAAVTRPTQIANGQIVTPTGVLEGGSLTIRDGRIARVQSTTQRPHSAPRVIDAGDRVVMPGLIDLHGDDIERHLYPRDNASVDTRLALVMADRTNLAAGITTKFHAIAFEETPEENRSIDAATETAATIDETEDLLIDNRVHARCELSAESVSAVADLLETLAVDLVSIMHHAPETGQFGNDEAFTDLYVSERGCSRTEAEQLLEERTNVPPDVLRSRARRIVDRAIETGAVVASHDDDSPESIEWMRNAGVSIAEYPVTIEAAVRAVELGMTTAMGAPNLVRGGSLWDNLSAERAVEANVLDVLCSDYHPPSLLSAVFVDTDTPLVERVARVTKNPANAVGLTDRGRIEEGARADLIVVDPDPVPTVECVLVGGIERFNTEIRQRSTARV
jgi:alpha-D-ribose 1-methylphosphonate 5-triphosphate diphosphatase